MCGIAGIWNVAAERPAATVGTMLDSMAHRGPDGRGTLEFSGGAAGMVRLALVDLSPRGQQPLWSADRRVAILFNGEIYNFRELRARLEKDGYAFQTTTDTEVILNLYLAEGRKFVDRLRGMYALAIFDWRQSSPGGLPCLLLARGPLGIKHLYIAELGSGKNGIAFSSEIRALLAAGVVPRTLDREALAEYLAHGFVLQPRTIIAGVRTLEPGTIEWYEPGKPTLRQRFWRVPPYEPRVETLEQAAERLRAELDESVALHAMADAPVGAFLSGGIDSTGVVGLMRRHSSLLRTYTLEFPDVPGQDEAALAADAARRFDCVHTTVQVTSREVAEILPRFACELDQPSIDGLNTWLVSRAAAHDVKAVLSGLGGDEWFAGYPVTRRMMRYGRTLGGRMQMMAGRLAESIACLVPEGHLRRRVDNLATRRSLLTTWIQGHTAFSGRWARRLLGLADGPSQEDRFAFALDSVSPEWKSESPVGLSCLLDAQIYMRNQLLRDSDATSMAHSLELRVPLVDLQIVDFSRTCDDRFKLRGDGGASGQYETSGAKAVLIRAMADVLPPEIANRPKRGFSLPHRHWMKKDLAPLVEATCHPSVVARRNLFDPQYVELVWREYQAGGSDVLFPRLWSLMIWELWCRGVLDEPARVDSAVVGSTAKVSC
ncbi:MAG TPA: asparagine synthase (glutamine-hydrolyzing) [Pirellulales bacterium]|nr:asparagine synthase (glutamine-hydrolyzing) [Pirellulales bacterium]